MSPVESDSTAAGAADSPLGGAVPDPESDCSVDWEASSFGASFAGDFSPPASSTVNDSNAETSVPSSTRTAIG